MLKQTGLEYLGWAGQVVWLNPLKVCLPSVTSMLPAITRKYQVVFCYTIIERNNRHMLPVVRSSAGGDCVTTNTNPLDSFFPFDPYLLKRSGELIEPLYQVWEELVDVELLPAKTGQGLREDEDDFLCGETPQNEGIVGMTPSSYDSNLRSPSSVGSPPFAFQKPF
ncbi:RNA polymerase I-specific transcription initiation factor RRN3 [Lates japonicus]|uniref:RNA polymerase I-specific transcription initiation factor RRN3 n=1 Tax=Lates japonicus TaxID=270547 RepID=A0AAD3MXC5_LATJO|nr:RNA polymerase I-specific transcription initiation factor RRN3 [Lates japonicus]